MFHRQHTRSRDFCHGPGLTLGSPSPFWPGFGWQCIPSRRASTSSFPSFFSPCKSFYCQDIPQESTWTLSTKWDDKTLSACLFWLPAETKLPRERVHTSERMFLKENIGSPWEFNGEAALKCWDRALLSHCSLLPRQPAIQRIVFLDCWAPETPQAPPKLKETQFVTHQSRGENPSTDLWQQQTSYKAAAVHPKPPLQSWQLPWDMHITPGSLQGFSGTCSLSYLKATVPWNWSGASKEQQLERLLLKPAQQSGIQGEHWEAAMGHSWANHRRSLQEKLGESSGPGLVSQAGKWLSQQGSRAEIKSFGKSHGKES